MDTDIITIKRIFISHSRKDSVFGDAIVKLLRGIGLTQNQIIYTSDPSCGIPPGQNIFNYLRDQISDDTYMLYLLSDNYYDSIVCLNEMGAAWVRQTDALMLLLPGFDTSNPKFQNGVSDPYKMAVKVDDHIQMWKIVGNLVRIFNLDPLTVDIQGIYKDYLCEIEQLKKMPAVQFAINLAETEQTLRNNPLEPSLYHDRGYYLYSVNEQNYPESVRSLIYAMYLDPNFSEAYYRLIQVAGTHRDFNKALAVAEEAMRRFPHHPFSYGCRAYALKNLGRDNEAVKDLCEAIQRGPNQWFYYMRGTSYQALEDVENALSDFWTVYHQYDPNYEDTVTRIVDICKKIGKEQLFTQANNLKAQAKDVQSGSVAAATPSFFEGARKYFECVLLIEPNYNDALREYGGLFFDAKQYNSALKYWTELLKLSQTSYHHFLCALANQYMGNEVEMRRLSALGLGCPDDGWHKHLQEMLQLQ